MSQHVPYMSDCCIECQNILLLKFRKYFQLVSSVSKGCYVHMEPNSSLKESATYEAAAGVQYD